MSIDQAKGGKINIVIMAKNNSVDQSMVAAKLLVSMGVFTYAGEEITPINFISKDKPNELQLGSDNKLVSRPDDTDFLAGYILASN